MSPRTAAVLAWSMLALSAALAAGALVLLTLVRISLPAGTASFSILFALIMLAYAAIGAFIAARRPQNPIGWIFCIVGLTGEGQVLAQAYAGYALLAVPGRLPAGELIAWSLNLWVPSWGLLPYVFLLFPDGRFLSRRWRLVVWLSAVSIATGLLTSGGRVGSIETHPSLLIDLLGAEVGGWAVQAGRGFSGLTMLAVYVIAAASLVVRFRRARGVERRQLEWIAYAAVFLVLVYVTLTVLFFNVPAVRALDPEATNSAALFGGVPVALTFVGLPVAAAVAILRYRLYEIDVIINRTLVYGTLTAMVALVYFGSVVVLQGLFRALVGQESNLAIVISTLLSAALFQPLRHRLQAVIDRRFYRRKYDAAHTLAAFSATLRDEVDLATLADELVRVVDETMQPDHVSLWLRRDAGRAERQGWTAPER